MTSLYQTYPFPFGLAPLAAETTAPQRTDLFSIFKEEALFRASRYIDPVTSDFVESADNHLQGMNAIEQEVIRALNTNFNSSSVLNFGQNFLSVPVITPYIQRQMQQLLSSALSFLIDFAKITITSLNVSANAQGQAYIQFTFLNNSLEPTQQ